MCAYELGMSDIAAMRWPLAAQRFGGLQEDNSWSKAFFTYTQAACLLACGRLAAAAERLRTVESLCTRRIGGRLISEEQFALKRAHELLQDHDDSTADDDTGTDTAAVASAADPDSEPDEIRAATQPTGSPVARVARSGGSRRGSLPMRVGIMGADSMRLQVPALELAYAFNLVPQMSTEEVHAAMEVIEACLTGMMVATDDTTPPGWPVGASARHVLTAALLHTSVRDAAAISRDDEHASAAPGRADDVAVCALLRGALLAAAGRPDEAEQCFRWIVERQGWIHRDAYVVPFACFELASLRVGGIEGAEEWARQAWGFTRDYNFKFRLHLRLHLLSDWMREAAAAASGRRPRAG